MVDHGRLPTKSTLSVSTASDGITDTGVEGVTSMIAGSRVLRTCLTPPAGSISCRNSHIGPLIIRLLSRILCTTPIVSTSVF